MFELNPRLPRTRPVGASIPRSPTCDFVSAGLNLPITGTLVDEVYIPYGGTITGWTIVGDAAGSVSIAVARSTYASYDTMATMFTAACTTSVKAQSGNISYPIYANDVLRFTGSGFGIFQRVCIVLTVSV